MNCLSVLADIASVLTAIVAVAAYGLYLHDISQKRQRLEKYLKAAKLTNSGTGAHTVLHLMAKVGLTESEILHASFISKHIARKLHANVTTGLADQILFEYQDRSDST